MLNSVPQWPKKRKKRNSLPVKVLAVPDKKKLDTTSRKFLVEFDWSKRVGLNFDLILDFIGLKESG
jgi:hypothetical protein